VHWFGTILTEQRFDGLESSDFDYCLAVWGVLGFLVKLLKQGLCFSAHLGTLFHLNG
jgi:hypothetical protein